MLKFKNTEQKTLKVSGTFWHDIKTELPQNRDDAGLRWWVCSVDVGSFSQLTKHHSLYIWSVVSVVYPGSHSPSIREDIKKVSEFKIHRKHYRTAGQKTDRKMCLFLATTENFMYFCMLLRFSHPVQYEAKSAFVDFLVSVNSPRHHSPLISSISFVQPEQDHESVSSHELKLNLKHSTTCRSKVCSC